MITFEKHADGVPTKKEEERFLASLRFRNYFIAAIVMGLLINCADIHFRKGTFGQGMLEIGQNMAHQNCKKQPNTPAYQTCINQVDKNYEEAYK